MLMTVEELKTYINTDEADPVLEAKLQALELSIRRYTNNNFVNRGYCIIADIRDGVFSSNALIPFEAGDTIMIADSDLQEGRLCVVDEVAGDKTFTVTEAVADDDDILVYKVEYPLDLKLCAAEILRWKERNAAAASGDQSAMPVAAETISRHSVTYAQDASEADIALDFGVPKKYIATLKAYKKARF